MNVKNVNLENIFGNIVNNFRTVEVLEKMGNNRNTNLSYKIKLSGINHVLKIYNQREKEKIAQNIDVQDFFIKIIFLARK